ncbi:TOMM precursor leader peptide-binding protein [Sorangium sp. So ce1335]|uniref:TOMM precursor leader peptide-binding protein n=1 Tax=Sorangium sp. So ce1335 TaxID=3133335 RepID=UPI003F61FF6F
MPGIRLSRSASITPTGVGVILQSDLGAFQLTGSDQSAFVERIVPLLDGSRDREAVVEALPGYSSASVIRFLDLLEARGFIEAALDAAAPLDRERLRGQDEFLRRWPAAAAGAQQRLAGARVLVAGLEPWGATAALALAAAGVAALHLVDDGVVGPGDAAVLRERGEAALGAPRRAAVAALIRGRAPRCRVDESSAAALEAGDLRAPEGPGDLRAPEGRADLRAPEGRADLHSPEGRPHLIVAAVGADDGPLLERVARFAHRARIVSLWSHLAGAAAVVGPLVFPGETACRICAEAGALNPAPAARPGGAPAPPAAAMGQLLGQLAAMEALKAITAYTPPRLAGRLLVQDLCTFETSHHMLVRLPWCTVCGEG